jgi:AcrR family transcriptional regulator
MASLTPTDDATAPTAKGEQTRLSILTVAIERFGRDGYRATSVADIARDAGVSGTLAYAYFENKEALFLAALDTDVAEVIDEGVSSVLQTAGDDSWRGTLIFTLMEAVERHPLARRMLAGLEPRVTDRITALPALDELRTAVGDRLRADQEAGLVRPDIDPTVIGGGAVSIFITLLMAVVQFGPEAVETYGDDVLAVLEAAIDAHPR